QDLVGSPTRRSSDLTTDGDATTSGNQHRTVSVPPGTTTKRVTFPENSGSHPVQYRVRPRVQGDIFIVWVKHITVGTHCKPKHHRSEEHTSELQSRDN